MRLWQKGTAGHGAGPSSLCLDLGGEHAAGPPKQRLNKKGNEKILI